MKVIILSVFSLLIACGPQKLSKKEIKRKIAMVGEQAVITYVYDGKPFTGLMYETSSGSDGKFVSSETTLKDGFFHGISKKWYSKGVLRTEKRYEKGSLSALKIYSKTKKLIQETNYDPNHSKKNKAISINGWAIKNSKEWYDDGQLKKQIQQLSPPETKNIQEDQEKTLIHSYKAGSKSWYKNNVLKNETEHISYYVETKGQKNTGAGALEVELSSKEYYEDGSLLMEFKGIDPNGDLSNSPESLKEYIAKHNHSSKVLKCGKRQWFFKNKKLSYEGTLCGEHIDVRKSFDNRNDYLLEKVFDKNGTIISVNEKLCSACVMITKYFEGDGSLKAEISEMNFFKYSDSEEYKKTEYIKFWGKNGLRFHRFNELDKDSKSWKKINHCWNVDGHPKDKKLWGMGCQVRLDEQINNLRNR